MTERGVETGCKDVYRSEAVATPRESTREIACECNHKLTGFISTGQTERTKTFVTPVTNLPNRHDHCGSDTGPVTTRRFFCGASAPVFTGSLPNETNAMLVNPSECGAKYALWPSPSLANTVDPNDGRAGSLPWI
jgi:hypothetical protein